MINFNPIIPFYLLCLFLFLSFFIIYKYFITLKSQEKHIKYILIFFRSLSLFLFFLILIQPVLLLSKMLTENKKISIFVDNSKSMSYSLNKYDFKDQLNLAIDKIENKNIDFIFYLFGDSIRKINNISEIDFTDQVTDLNQISESIKYLNSDEYIIISDGMQNQGMSDFLIDDNNIINIFGVVSVYEIEDLAIDTIFVKSVDEKYINVKCKVFSSINYEYKNIPIKLSNDKVSNKILTHINIHEKNNSFFYDFAILKSDLSNNNIIYIDYIKDEFDKNNNHYSLILNSEDLHRKRILLFSGRLSQNTNYIKNLIKKYPNLDVSHFYDFRNFDLQSLDSIYYDAVIFDSFPIDHTNSSIISKSDVLKNKNLAFFQGPSIINDYNFYNQFLLDWGYTFTSNNNNDLKAVDFYHASSSEKSYENIISNIVPIKTDRRVINNKRESFFYNNNNNTIIDYHNNNLFVFIPNLIKISNETLNIYKNDNLEFLIHSFLQKVIFGVDKYPVKIYTDKDIYYINEKFNLYINIANVSIPYNEVDVYIYNKDGSIQSKINECELSLENLYVCNVEVEYIGNYFIQAKISTQNDFNIQSNQIDINFNDLDVEIKNIGLNKKILENIALNYSGRYYNLEKLNNYIYSIKSNPSSYLKIKEIPIFNFQSVWFLIILFLIIEWIVRKNKGLL